MNKLKENFEFIIGFVAIVISLSAFKEELKDIKIILSFINFDLAKYFFCLIIGYLIILEIYVIPLVLINKYPNSKILKFLGNSSYILFLLLTFSPFLILIIYFVDKLITSIPQPNENVNKYVSVVLAAVIGAVSSYFANMVVLLLKRLKREEQIEDLSNIELADLESANRLFKDEYYTQSIIEMIKVLENRLRRIIISRGIEIRNYSLLELLRISQKLKILNDNDIKLIDEIRILRNKVAHESNINVDKNTVERYLEILKQILEKTSQIPSLKEEIGNKFFKGKIFSNFKIAKRYAHKVDRPIFMVIFDGDHPLKSRLDWALGYFMEYETTKKLVQENFVQLVVDKTKEDVSSYIPKDDPLETCLLVIIYKDQIIRQETVYANMDEGLKRVRESINTIKELKK